MRIATTFAVTSWALRPADPLMAAKASAFAPAVTPSICEDEADSVRSRTEWSGAISPAKGLPAPGVRQAAIDEASASNWGLEIDEGMRQGSLTSIRLAEWARKS